jgi:hypothetical protein
VSVFSVRLIPPTNKGFISQPATLPLCFEDETF